MNTSNKMSRVLPITLSFIVFVPIVVILIRRYIQNKSQSNEDEKKLKETESGYDNIDTIYDSPNSDAP